MLFRSAESALVRLLVLMMRPRVSMISRFSSRSSSSNSSIIGIAEVAHISGKEQARGAAADQDGCCRRTARRARSRGMASTQDLRKNLKMLVDGTPYVCLEAQFVKPGKGQAFSRCRLKNLITGNVIE